MKTSTPYPFYHSLRFRFGLLFGLVFLCFLLISGFILYTNVKGQFEKSFASRLRTQGNLILQETEINPLTIPFPNSGEYFKLTYLANNSQQTLFNNLPANIKNAPDQADPKLWRSAELQRSMETGGLIRICYVVPATELMGDINRLQVILFLYFPLSFLAAFVVGYLLSGFLLRPIEHIVGKANDISLENRIDLLAEPAVQDELHMLIGALNRMLARIRIQAQNQNAFFASASHELRTPLSVMLTELQTFRNNGLPAAIRPILESQITEVQRLSKLVDDFLLMSQLKSGALILNKTEISLPELTIEILERLASRALLNQQTFKLALFPEDATFLVQTDRSHLTTILTNLFENVIKHGQSQSTVRISMMESDNEISLAINNLSRNLISELPLLTSEFHKGDLSSDGFGLGLWIVSKLSDTIGSRLEIRYVHPEFSVQLHFHRSAPFQEI